MDENMEKFDIGPAADDNYAFSLESILAEYKAEARLAEENDDTPLSSEDKAKNIVMEALDEQIYASSVSSQDEAPDIAESNDSPAEDEPDGSPATVETEADEISLPYILADIDSTFADEETASPGDYTLSDDQLRAEASRQKREHIQRSRTLGEAVSSPLVALLAMIAMRRHSSGKTVKNTETVPDGSAEEQIPEVSPSKAAKHYAAQVKPLHIRGMIAAFLCVILVYIAYSPSLGLPMAGALGRSIRVAAGVCLVLELVVMLCGLDILTTGLLSLFSGNPGAESLVALSCIFSAVDALVIALGKTGYGLPFCAVSALSMTFAIRGARLVCSGLSASLRTAAVSKAPYSVTAEQGVSDRGGALLKSQRGLEGFVRRCEESDFSENAHRAVAPFLIVAALILSILAAVTLGSAGSFLHIFSALLAASASFSALLCFAQPFTSVARQLLQSGAAIAGWPGCADIGASRQVIVTDTDLFPAGTVASSGIRIIEGNFADRVISYTGSLLAASGSGVSAVFTELISKNGYTMLKVEDFSIHEGGGLTATINNDRVLVGNSGFMNLMGIRLSQSLISKSAIFTAVNGNLAGIFSINYTPITSVQDALVNLLHSRGEPLFAIRDFNITPLMIRQKFKMPTESFDFPSFARRYQISAAQPGANSQIVAVLSRVGLGPLVGASDKGRRLCRGVKLCTVLSILGSVLGMVLMFFLCRSGAFDSATVANELSFMFLWLVPVIIVTFSLRR